MDRILKIGPAEFSPRLVIFDKDGTLIDFNYMWAPWVIDLAQRLESACGFPLAGTIFKSFGFDASTSRVLPNGPLATWSMTSLRDLASTVLVESNIPLPDAERAVELAWRTPDAVKFAHPVADLTGVFKTLRGKGVKIAVATSDDRNGTEETLEALGLAGYVNAVVAADDGPPTKPAPDMVLHLCRILQISPKQSVVVGDSQADMEMGRSASAGLTVGVLTGVSSKEVLASHADVVIPSIEDLV